MSKKDIKSILYIITDIIIIIAFSYLICDIKNIKDIIINGFLVLFINIWFKDLYNSFLRDENENII